MDILNEFAFYDILGRLVPGLIVLGSVFSSIPLRQAKKACARLTKHTLLFIVSAYVAGSMIHSLANWIYRPLFGSTTGQVIMGYSDAFREDLYRQFEHSLGIKTTDNASKTEQAFVIRMCRTYCKVWGCDDFVQLMYARYAFYRTLILAMFAATLAFLSRTIYSAIQSPRNCASYFPLLLSLLCGTAMLISIKQTAKFDAIRKDTVYRTFYVHSIDKGRRLPGNTEETQESRSN